MLKSFARRAMPATCPTCPTCRTRASLALALLCALALAHAHDKRESETSAVPSFTFTGRYGRSPERSIEPRMDRWMLTARYGKRSVFTQPPAPPAPLTPGLRGPTLMCQYTGVLQLYRCTRAGESSHRPLALARRSDDDPAAREA